MLRSKTNQIVFGGLWKKVWDTCLLPQVALITLIKPISNSISLETN